MDIKEVRNKLNKLDDVIARLKENISEAEEMYRQLRCELREELSQYDEHAKIFASE